MGPRRREPERRHREDLPGLRCHREPAEALGRHVVQPAAAGRPVAQPAVVGADQLHADAEEEDTARQQTAPVMGLGGTDSERSEGPDWVFCTS